MHDVPALIPALPRRSLLAAAAATGTAVAGALLGCSNGASAAKNVGVQPVTGSTFAFDTYCTFTVYGDDSAPAKLAKACARFDRLFDLRDPKSDIARINAAAGKAAQVDPDTVDLIADALAFCEEADGLFDITIGAVSTLWDFHQGVKPADENLARGLEHVNWRTVKIDAADSSVQLTDPHAKLDLGGIAKGFIADRLIDLLENDTQATGASISLGGNIALFGSKPDGEPWGIGIRDPNDPGGSSVIGTAHMARGSLVTSGLYERTFKLDGTTYWHILDPRTGMPVATDVKSATVACPSSTTADALSTALFVAGSRVGADIATAHSQTAAFFIKEDDSTAETANWQAITGFETSEASA